MVSIIAGHNELGTLQPLTALADDLANALRVPAVPVVSPIPGKNTVGVEVPNEKQVMVRLKELIESSPADSEKHRIPIFLGKDVSGRPLVVDLTKMPHLLIAGATGSGKSVCINSIVASILYSKSPKDVRLLMVDPKVVEMAPFKDIPHLMCPIINETGRATSVLEWACQKMDERYEFLAEAATKTSWMYAVVIGNCAAPICIIGCPKARSWRKAGRSHGGAA